MADDPSHDPLETNAVRLGNERAFQFLADFADRQQAQYLAIVRSRSYRYLQGLRRLYGGVRRRLASAPAPSPGLPVTADLYDLWLRSFDTIDDPLRLDLHDRVGALPQRPLISVVLPVFNTPAKFLRLAVESVRSQLYPDWELCIADDASTEAHVGEMLDEYAQLDRRIKVVHRQTNGHICEATNSALEMASGQWIAFLDHDDALRDHALALMAFAIATHPGAGMLYSDEDKLDAAERRHSPYFKPDFDPLLLLGQNYLTHLLVIRHDLVDQVGAMRVGYEGSQDWDLVLRVSELLEEQQVVHVPHVLYHWRVHGSSTAAALAAKPYAADAGQRAVGDHLDRVARAAEVVALSSGYNRIRWPLPQPPPLVTIIVPTRDGRMLRTCIDSLLLRTAYPHIEVVVVDNGSQSEQILDYLKSRQSDLRVMRDDRPFNYAALNNEAVKQSSGEVICLLNDDTEVVSEDWLGEMVAQLAQPGVGVVGAKLYYGDGRIQHAGVVLGVGGVAGHAYKRAAHDYAGWMGRLYLAQTMSAVTGACAVVRRQAWQDVDGMDEDNLAVAFNDVDLCLRLRQAGWRTVWTPHAELFHHESVSRGSETERRAGFAAEERYMFERWGTILRSDPAYNPNLTLVTEDWTLAWPPRASYR